MQRNPITLAASICAAAIALASCVSSRTGDGGDSPSAARTGSPSAASITGPVTLQNLRAHVNASTLAALPSGRGSNKLLDRHRLDGDAQWANNWTRAIDMSGVAWDKPRTVTLISPRHVVMAKHFQRPVRSGIVFHDRNGKIHVRTLVSAMSVPDADFAVGVLDRDVPVKFYKVLPPRMDYPTWLGGALAIVTDQDARLFVHRITIRANVVLFSKVDEIHRSHRTEFLAGDSGNPSFLLIRGEPVLIETHSIGGTGAGTFISHPAMFTQINRIMRLLPGDYQLTTANLDAQPQPLLPLDDRNEPEQTNAGQGTIPLTQELHP